jgi:glutaredoxin
MGERPARGNERGALSSVLGTRKERSIMTRKAVFYHAGCPVCVSAEQGLAHALDPASYQVEIVHLGETPDRIAEAEAAGVVSVPALVIGDQPYHINFGASLADVKGAA